MLERPAWHIYPWQTQNSASYLSELEEGGFGSGGRRGFGSVAKKSAKKYAPHSHPRTSSPIHFLSEPAKVIANLTPNQQGKLEINLDKFQGFQRIDAILTQGPQFDAQQLTLGSQDIKKIDLRLAKSLEPKTSFKATETYAILKPKASVTIENIVDAEWKSYTTLDNLFSYFHTHASTSEFRDKLNQFAPLLQWPTLNQQERLQLVSKIHSHECHLFIHQHDNDWFNTHIKPTLVNKRRKDFIDHYLLGHDLSHYAKPRYFHNLNTIEKAILAQQLKSNAIKAHLEAEYERVKPDSEAETILFTSLLKQGFESDLDFMKLSLAPDASSIYIRRKLQNIILPSVNFQNISLAQAIDILYSRARELDTLELDPQKKGVHFSLSTTLSPHSNNSEFGGSKPPLIRSLQLKNVPLEIVLQQLCDMTQTRYKVENGAISILPATDFDNTDFYTRNVQVPPDFMTLLNDGSGSMDDPFADDTPNRLTAQPPLKELLESAGITFPEGASASFNRATNTITIRNTANNLDMIEMLTTELRSPSTSKLEDTITLRSRSNITTPEEKIASDAFSDDPFAESVDNSSALIIDEAALPHETKAYEDAYYFKHKQLNGSLDIQANRFWIQFAQSPANQPFLSPHFAECKNTPHEALITLALSDLPFKSEKPKVKIERNSMQITANKAMLLFYRDLQPSKTVGDKLLANLRYFRQGDRISEDQYGRERENTITGSFQTLTPYEAHLVITNPSGIAREIDILRQIPSGAIPLDTPDTLLSLSTTLSPHSSWQHVIRFYFPKKGEHQHYPPQVHENGAQVADIQTQTMNVVDHLPVELKDTWLQLVFGNDENAILDALKKRPAHTINVEALSSRMAQPQFYQQAMPILKERLMPTAHFTSHAIALRDLDTLADYLSNPTVSSNYFGTYFTSETCDINLMLTTNLLTQNGAHL
ncbi:hypothetical protein [Rubritalea tangerina]|uniref:hypothetical protein n=1 Tax=Rubritalea tangerina TaxID=430798 RepID=UPI00361F5396